MRILIVDKDHKSLLATARPLRKAGYDVVEAMRAEQVLSDAQKGRFDIVIMSIFLPGMGGIEAIQRIHSINPHCQIIAVSAGVEGMSAEKAIAAAKKIGASAGFIKPLDVDALLEMVHCLAEPDLAATA